MNDHPSIEPVLADALETISDFIRQITGTAPSPAETADALTRYFVLNEIKEHIVMLREENGDS